MPRASSTMSDIEKTLRGETEHEKGRKPGGDCGEPRLRGGGAVLGQDREVALEAARGEAGLHAPRLVHRALEERRGELV